MLSNINLDDEKFSGIVESGKEMLPELVPEWTDYNEHDPGITFLELFAWKKEMQQYRMDRIGSRNRRKYLEMLGGRQQEAQSASALLHIPCREEVLLQAGTPFYAGSLRFETAEEEYLSAASLISILCSQNGKEAEYDLARLRGSLCLPVFGDPAIEGNSFSLLFNRPLDPERLLHIYFELRDTGRNSFDETFLPLSGIRTEIMTGSTWQKVQMIADETHGFLVSGRISFRLPGRMEASDKGYPIRFTLEEAGYDFPPVLDHLGIHRVKVFQQHTLAEMLPGQKGKEAAEKNPDSCDLYAENENGYVLIKEVSGDRKLAFAVRYDRDFYAKRIPAIGTGFPNQKYPLEIPELTSSGFRLLVETEKGSGLFREWQLVDHLEASRPEDCHFTLEDDSLVFGNGYHGMMPEGEIRIAACHTCAGKSGNVRADSISRCEDRRIGAFTHPDLTGGKDRETVDEAIRRAGLRLQTAQVAVTLQDYETLAMQTPGLVIKACSAGYTEENTNRIILSVTAGNRTGGVSRAYLKNIENYMEKRIPLGSSLKVISCRYIGISVFLEVSSRSYGETVKRKVKEEVQALFETYGDRAGALVSKSDLYGILERMSIISGVRSVSIEAREGGAHKTAGGDIQLPPGGMAWLKDLQCIVASAE